MSTPTGNCNFDTGVCTWHNDVKTDQFDWLVTSETTDSQTTGPVADHTFGNKTGTRITLVCFREAVGSFIV